MLLLDTLIAETRSLCVRQAEKLNVFFVTVFATIANGELAAASGTGHSPSISDLTFPWINFILYVALLTYLLRGPIVKGWSGRRQNIKARVEGAAEQLQTAERELNAVEALVQCAAQEQERIKTEVSGQAAREAEMIVAQAQERTVRMKQQAKEMLEGEMRSAQSSFRSRLVERALQVAKQKFATGEYESRESVYTDTAVTRAKQLVQ
jgi:F0F1-type ATP synthase membrane subunit b/b'